MTKSNEIEEIAHKLVHYIDTVWQQTNMGVPYPLQERDRFIKEYCDEMTSAFKRMAHEKMPNKEEPKFYQNQTDNCDWVNGHNYCLKQAHEGIEQL